MFKTREYFAELVTGALQTSYGGLLMPRKKRTKEYFFLQADKWGSGGHRALFSSLEEAKAAMKIAQLRQRDVLLVRLLLDQPAVYPIDAFTGQVPEDEY